MNERTIKCPHCNEDIRLELVLTDIKALEFGIGVKVYKEKAKEQKEKEKKK